MSIGDLLELIGYPEIALLVKLYFISVFSLE